jgi:hypothetical protein
MLARTPEEINDLIAEAEAIRDGQDPPGDSTPLHTPGGDEGADPKTPGESAPSPSAGQDFSELGTLLVCLTDGVLCHFFGPQAAMRGELRAQTVTAWARVLEKYAPVVQQAGPLGTLAVCYGTHAVLMLAAGQWTDPLSARSGEAEAAKQPCSAS